MQAVPSQNSLLKLMGMPQGPSGKGPKPLAKRACMAPRGEERPAAIT